MSKQIDWSKAPEGYPLWITDDDGMINPSWHKEEADKYVDIRGCFWNKGNGGFTVHTRPTTPSWSGEGLPPVGVMCEVKQMARGAEREWFKALVLYSSPYTVVLDDCQAGEFVSHPCTLQFRPIRTPEQIAADEREAQIVAIHDAIVTSVKVTLGQCDSWRKVAEMVYNAGFKRE